MSGGSGNQQVQTTRTEPYGPATGHLGTILSGAESLYNTGGPNPYTGQRIAGFTSDQTNSFNSARTGAGVLQQGAGDGRALNTYGSLLGDQMGRATGNPLANNATAQGQMSTYGALQGDQMGRAMGDPTVNPFARQIMQNQASDMTDQMNRQFSGMGRIGSYANARALTDNVGRFITSASGDMYDRANAQKQQAVGNVMNLAGAQGDVYNQALGQQNQAAQNAMQLGGAIPGLYQQQAGMHMGAHDALAGIGQQQQGFNQHQLQSVMDLYNEQQNRPFDNLNRWENNVLPVANGGGSTSTTSGNQTSPLQTILGIGLGGLGLATGGFGGAAAGFGAGNALGGFF